MPDFVICSVPKYTLGVPLQGPAVLKAALQNSGYSCLYLDFNEDLGARISSLFPGRSWEELEPIFAFEKEFASASGTLWPVAKEWAETILEQKPENIGISVFTQRSRFMAKMLTEALRNGGYRKPIIHGGNHSAVSGKAFKEAGLIDHYVLGAGEKVIVEFAKGKRNIPGLDSPPGTSNGLGDYCEPDYSDLPLERYGGLYVTASRSCPFSCTFCENPSVWGKFAVRDPASVAKEIFGHYRRYGITNFHFTDNLINGHMPTYRLLMRKLSAPGLPIFFDAFFVIRSHREMSPGDFDLAKAAGARTIRIGVESGSQRVRDHMRKRYRMEDLDYFLDQFARTGIRTDLMLVVGYPTESESHFEETLKLLTRYQPHAKAGVIRFVRIVPLAVLPNAPLWRMRDDLGISYEGDQIGDWRCGHLDREERLRRYRSARSHALALGYNIRSSQDAERTALFSSGESISQSLGESRPASARGEE
jgi:radical SAM superfamily enzyme YgiQ (UPF0313 family)